MIIGDINVVFGLVILFFGLSMIRARAMGRRQGKLQQEIAVLRATQASPAPQLHTPTVDQVQILEDRVRVLERIVTDQNYSLASQIEALRDRPQKIEQGSDV